MLKQPRVQAYSDNRHEQKPQVSLRMFPQSKNQQNFHCESELDPFTVNQTEDSNLVFETIRRPIFHVSIFLLSLQFAIFLCINAMEDDENLTGPTLESEELIFCFFSF